MTNLSIEKYKFCDGNLCVGLFGVYTSVRHLLNISDEISNDQVHERTVNYYFNHKEINSYGWCDDAKRQALAILYDIIICLVCQLQDDKGQSIVTIKFYGKKSSLGKKFVYMLHDETKFNFYPLYVTNKENSTDRITMFDDHDMVKSLLRTYIEDGLKYVGGINLDYDDSSNVDEVSTPTHDSNAIERVLNPILMNTSTKRKESEYDDIAMSSNNDKPLPIEISVEYYVPIKRTKITEDASDLMSTSGENNSKRITTEDHIQTKDIRSKFEPHMNQQQIADISMALNDEYQKEKLEDEKEPDNKLHDGVLDNDKFNYNSESSETKPVL